MQVGTGVATTLGTGSTGSGTTVTVVATTGTELGLGTITGGLALALGGGYLIGDFIGVSRDAELQPNGVNSWNTVTLSQRGVGNVSYDEILDMLTPEARKDKKKMCEELLALIKKLRNEGKCDLADKAKSTWKDKCRGVRGQ
jgi:hypothetical protein